MFLKNIFVLLFVSQFVGISGNVVILGVRIGDASYEFVIRNVFAERKNDDGSTTYSCRRHLGTFHGNLTVRMEDTYFIRILQSDGICPVNNCNLPPMKDMRFNLKTGYHQRCKQQNINYIKLGDGKFTCAWMSKDCEPRPGCLTMTSPDIKVKHTANYKVEAIIRCNKTDVGFYCFRSMPNVWFVNTKEKHPQPRIVSKVSCDRQLACLPAKAIVHATFHYRGDTLVYTCDKGYHQQSKLKEFTCNKFTGDWSSVDFKCSRRII